MKSTEESDLPAQGTYIDTETTLNELGGHTVTMALVFHCDASSARDLCLGAAEGAFSPEFEPGF